jgi:hypothetical protein
MNMEKRLFDRQAAERMTPLLRSITQELVDRRRAVEALEQELAAQRSLDERSDAVLLREAELATHRRELRQLEKEVERLGLELDEDHPLRILIPSSGGAWAYEARLDDTQFYRPVTDAAV